MNDFVPRDLFQQRRNDAETLAAQANEPYMRTAMVYALSQLALNGASEAELKGARAFIHTFLNLSEKPSAPVTYPPKTLEHV